MSDRSTLETRSTPVEVDLKGEIVSALKTVYDPEIPVDIYELGLIYEIAVREENAVYVKMTLTSPMCPVAEILPVEVEEKVRAVPGVSRVQLDLVWDPPWDIEMMSEAARLELHQRSAGIRDQRLVQTELLGQLGVDRCTAQAAGRGRGRRAARAADPPRDPRGQGAAPEAEGRVRQALGERGA